MMNNLLTNWPLNRARLHLGCRVALPISTDPPLGASGALNKKVVESFMKDSESCTLHTDELNAARPHIQRCGYIFMADIKVCR